MTVTAWKHNPGFFLRDKLHDGDKKHEAYEELVEFFCVRKGKFEELVKGLREYEYPGSGYAHHIVIGERGSGKTTLLLRVVAEIHRVDDLRSRFFPIVFAEESHAIASTGELGLECLFRLAEQASPREGRSDLYRRFEELRNIRDDQMLGERCLDTLRRFSEQEGKCLVVVVENLNRLFSDLASRDAGERLRWTLDPNHSDHAPWIRLLASATPPFDEIGENGALHGLFHEHRLSGLDEKECGILWKKVSGRDHPARMINPLKILTGGNPRFLTVMARFRAGLSFSELGTELRNLLDDHTAYFQSLLDALGPQERRVYLALADLWKPATLREIADRARLDTSNCSVHLLRLTRRGVVVEEASGRPKQYYLAERLSNIYFLMRRSHGSAPRIDALIRFMELFYEPFEIAKFAREALRSDVETREFETGLRLADLPSLAEHREDLLLSAQGFVVGRPDGHRSEPAQATVSRRSSGFGRADRRKLEETLAESDESVRRHEGSDEPEDLERVAMALVNKGVTLVGLGRQEEALAVWEELERRFGSSDAQALRGLVAGSRFNRGVAFVEPDQRERRREAFDDVVLKLGRSDAPADLEMVAMALVNKGVTLVGLDRREEALDAWREVVDRFKGSEEQMLRNAAEMALVNSAWVRLELGRTGEAEEALDQVLEGEDRGRPGVIQGTGHVLRARARLAGGNGDACKRDVEKALEILPGLGPLPKKALDALAELAVDLGPDEMGDLIRKSPSAELLRPLTKALEWRRTGSKPKDAKEIVEFAEDIRQHMKEYERRTRTQR